MMLNFKAKIQLHGQRFMNNKQEHIVNDVLRTDWEYRINLPLLNKQPERHDLERLIYKFMCSLNRKIYTKKELDKGLQVQCLPVLENEITNPHFHILLKVPASHRLNSKPDKDYFIKNKVLQLITAMNLVSLHKIDPKHTKTFQIIYDSLGAVEYNLKQGIKQIDFTNLRLANIS